MQYTKQAEDVGYYDRHKLFSKSLYEKLQETVRRLQRWVELTTPAVKQAVREYSQRTRKQAQDIRKFFISESELVTTKNKLRRTKDTDNTTTTTTVTPEDNNAPT